MNGDILNNVRIEASRHFGKTKKEHLKDNRNNLVTNSKNKIITDVYGGINEFKRSYQPRNDLDEDDNCNLLSNSHNILITWKGYSSQLLGVHSVRDIRQIEILTANH
jgi:hypothetical protein